MDDDLGECINNIYFLILLILRNFCWISINKSAHLSDARQHRDTDETRAAQNDSRVAESAQKRV
jgi:hypothetical protein